MLTVCTGWSPRGWEEYGNRFIGGFAKYWPKDVRLLCYVEEPVDLPRGECRDLFAIPGCKDFLDRHHDNLAARGRDVQPNWKQSAKDKGYNWMFDAWKFCRQGFIPLAAAEEVGEGLLVWLDADVVTHQSIPEGAIERLLPEGKDVAYLGREPRHPEIGFQIYRIPQALPMLKIFRDAYASDAVFALDEWHSAYVFNVARKASKIRGHNMTPGGSRHVWFESPLAQWMDHLKGDRKSIGFSAERYVRRKRRQ